VGEVFEVYVKTHFSAAHSLCGYPGDCARMHGHNWMVEVYVACRKLDEIGIGIDFREIKKTVAQVLGALDHQNLNDLEAFANQNPTSEIIARYLYKELQKKLARPGLSISRVKVSETPGAGAFYWEE